MNGAPILAALMTLAVSSASAQTIAAQSNSGSQKAKDLQGDYAVPEAPALLLLNVDDSKMLRPVSVKDLTSNLSSSSKDFSFIPTSFAVEFSPAMLLAGNKVTISEYQANPALYQTRLSLAANRDPATKRSRVAAAFRMSADDKSDLRTNRQFLQSIDRLTSLKIDSARARTFALIKAGIPPVGPYSAEVQTRVDSIDAALKIAEADQNKAIALAIAEAKRAMEAAKWNESVFDFAVGVKASSVDSVGKDPRFDGVAGWLTKGVKLGSNEQLLLGARGAYERDSTETDLNGAGDAVLRLYLGSNTAKISGEGSLGGKAASAPVYALKVGGEYEASSAFWLEFSVGWSARGSQGKGFTHSVKFHLTPPTL